MAVKNISLIHVEEKAKLNSNVPWLIALKVHVTDPLTNEKVGELNVVRNDEPVYISGELYEPAIFDVETKSSLGELPSLNLTIQDPESVVSSHVQAYKGGVGSRVEFMVFAVTDGAIEPDPELTEYFDILNSSIADYAVSWTLGVENPLRVIFPGRSQYNDQCSWRYKDENCAYSGALGTCDLTLNGPNGCRVHSNSANYGGFPGIR